MTTDSNTSRLWWIAVAALALTAIALAIGMFTAQREVSHHRELAEISRVHIANLQQRLEAERVLAQRQMESLSTTGDLRLLRVTRVNSTDSNNAPIGYWIWNPATQRGLLFGESLPQIPEGEYYHVWVVDAASNNAIRSASFQPTPGKSAHVELQPVQPVTHATEIRISVEKSSTASKPRGTVLATGKL